MQEINPIDENIKINEQSEQSKIIENNPETFNKLKELQKLIKKESSLKKLCKTIFHIKNS